MTSVANRLFLKLSGLVLLLLLAVGGAYLVISSSLSEDYRAEVNQQLYGDIARHTVEVVKPLVDGRVDTTQIQDIMHSMMVVNPSIEVYLLLPDGQIITYVAPNKEVQSDRVDLAPVRQFIGAASAGARPFVKGDDPRHPDRQNIFSAAEIRDDAGALEGYIYIILSGDEQHAVTTELYGGYMTRLGATLFFLSLLAALVVGLVGLRYLTRHLRRIVATIQRFREGDYDARIPEKQSGDFAEVAATFNHMAERITEHIDEMRSVDRLRRELIANISHDLRTPLAVIQGFVETLLMKEGNTLSAEQRHRHLTTIHNCTERLGKLVTHLFEYSKLEARQISPHKEPFHVGELAQDLVHKFDVLARPKDVDIALDIPNALPLIFADVSLVERVLDNLMDNALKFTPEGGRIRLKMRPTQSSVEITISDTGPGIPAAEQPYVFDRFRRGGPESEGRAGVGLGLAIVRRILELHDEVIRIDSRVREGTSFVFHLPFSRSQPPVR